ncbi:hypothetical protein NEIELOOT_01841 [Neisseria elongata subsp. glycolytica ATCC 29315]|uniref:Uncharacterized protein n=1 Tax=Neisseria elongata subsp. glycolytica ATCC 29315 TaxID=546263 RepID=D4DRZ8_NEIEG|nr:hypothetical protein NEIELOOT_01841 [Neisseria elongata subsp. glycolytica ATCC 29315]
MPSVFGNCRFPPSFTQSDIFRVENPHKISGPIAVSPRICRFLGKNPCGKVIIDRP